MSIEHITALTNKINECIFTIERDLDYIEITEKLIELANTLMQTETDESVWYIGDDTCSLDSLIVGAYWHYTEWHGGQSSPTYVALCALGQVYSPGMTSGPEPDSAEEYAYQMLGELAQARVDEFEGCQRHYE